MSDHGVPHDISGFPLVILLGVAAVLFGAAWLCFWRALAPFGLLTIRRRDVTKAIGYGVASACLFVAGFSVGMFFG